MNPADLVPLHFAVFTFVIGAFIGSLASGLIVAAWFTTHDNN